MPKKSELLIEDAIASFEIEGIKIPDDVKEIGRKILASEVDPDKAIADYVKELERSLNAK